MEDPGDLSFAEPYGSGYGKAPAAMLKAIVLALGGMFLAVLAFGWLVGS